MLIVTISRTMHTYTSTIKILCSAFNINDDGAHCKGEKRLIEAAFALKREGKTLVTVIDEAHLMDMETMKRMRLMFDELLYPAILSRVIPNNILLCIRN